MNLIADHLWQSTLFSLVVLFLTLAFRSQKAQTRYWLWLAASLKFFVPFGLLVTAGSYFERAAAPPAARTVSAVAEQIAQPFTTARPLAEPAGAASPVTMPTVCAIGIWLAGAAAVLAVWSLRWLRIRQVLRSATSCDIESPVPVRSTSTLQEPGVVGILRPVLLLPDGIAERLTPEQLQAVLTHELCHVRRRDNLAAAVHMIVEAIFWFHPLVWWIGAKLLEERELACDEEVVRLGNSPQVYAEGIVNVCRMYVQVPLPCTSGVTASDLTKRIAAIMAGRITPNLTLTRKIFLAAAGVVVVALPLLIGMLRAPRLDAQTTPGRAPLKFDVASIRPANPSEQNSRLGPVPGGGLRATNVPLEVLIRFAYDVDDFQLSGAPGWVRSTRYDILAKPDSAEGPSDFKDMTLDQHEVIIGRLRERTRHLLAERFQLAVHRDTKELPIYALVVPASGHKLRESNDPNQHMRGGPNQINAVGANIAMLAHALSRSVGRKVLDQTGLTGRYDFQLSWTPDAAAPEPVMEAQPASSIFTAVHDQLGLKLDSKRGPVEIIVIDRIEKPSEN